MNLATADPAIMVCSNDDHANIAKERNSRLFRTISTALCFAYFFLMIYQKIAQKKFPSDRFDRHRLILLIHIISGAVIIYSGCFLHIQNGISTRPVQESLFYIMGAMTCCHTATILPMAPHVMGEKRITTPLYIGAGLINLHNGIILLLNPCLENAFVLWGSVNTFVYQRVLLVGLMFSDLDWELLYTYSLLSAASITYPLSFQRQYVYMLVILPILYGPFHETISQRFGFPIEDTAGGNVPSKKNTQYKKKEVTSRTNAENSDDIFTDEGDQHRMNWMKSASIKNSIFVEATSVSHVQEIVQDNVKYPSPVRPAGRILSPTAICSNSGGTTLSTLKLNRIHGIKYVQVPNGHDQAGEIVPCVDVECGVTLRDAQIYAHKNSLELPFSGEIGMATIGGTAFAVARDSSIGTPPVKGMGLGDVASMIWSVDVVKSDGQLKTYCIMNKEDGQFNGEFQDLMDTYGTRGIAVRMLLVMRPKTPITTTLTVFPFKKAKTSHARCATNLFELWKEASNMNGNILAFLALRKGYVLVEERLPTEEARHTFAPFSFLLVHFYHWLKRITIQRGWPPFWLSFLRLLSGTFILRFNLPSRHPGNDYDKDVPLEKDKVTFTFASFPMNRFTDIATSMLDFILAYEQQHGFTPEGIVMYVVNISDQRITGPFRADAGGATSKSAGEQEYRFCFDPVHFNPNDKAWENFAIAFNDFAKVNGGRPCLNQTLMLEKDVAYGAQAISSVNASETRFVSPWLEQFLHFDV